MSWNRLTQSQKADLMRIYLDNGISSLDQMRNHYNSLKDGGKLPYQYATGGQLNTDGPDDPPSEEPTVKVRLKPVRVRAKHPLWDLPEYRGMESNPSINRYKDELFRQRQLHDVRGLEYLKRVADVASVVSLPIGGAAGLILQVPDATLDLVGDYPIAEEVLDAPVRGLAELDNGVVGDKIERGIYHIPKVGKIIGPAFSAWRRANDAVQYLGAANDATDLLTGESGIEKILK